MALKVSTGLVNAMAGHETDLVSNGDFTTNTTGWSATNANLTVESGGQDGNALRVASSGANIGKAYQDIDTVVGHVYKLSLYFKKGTSDNGKFMIGTTGDEDAIYDSGNLSDAAWTQYTVYFEATATTTRITMQSTDPTDTEYSDFDEIEMADKSASLRDIFEGNCLIDIYTGAQPSDADDAPTGTLLVTISDNSGGDGLHFNEASAGVLTLLTGQTNTGVSGNSGVAGWFRIRESADAGGSSTSAKRIDGAVATSGAELNISSTSITSGATQTISSLSLTLPKAA